MAAGPSPTPGGSRVFSGCLWVDVMEMNLVQVAEGIPQEGPLWGTLRLPLEKLLGPLHHHLFPFLSWSEFIHFTEGKGTFITCRLEANGGDTTGYENWSLSYGVKSLPEEVTIKQSPITTCCYESFLLGDSETVLNTFQDISSY